MNPLLTTATTETPTIEKALQIAQNYLSNFASSADFNAKMQLAFGNHKIWEKADLIDFPTIEIRPAAEINNARGAFAAATNTIYLSQELVNENTGNVGAIASVLLEEYGHYIDAQNNAIDSPGDEGELFANLVQSKGLSESELLGLKTEDDFATIILDGKTIGIEQAEISDSGGFEGSQETIKLESQGAGKVRYSYEMFTIPDNLILRYEGKNILDTGFVSGSKTGEVDIPNGNSDQLEVILATNDEGTQWNYTVSTQNQASLVFRELNDTAKDGTWGGRGDDVPGWDHVGLSFNEKVYESHPGYSSGQYWDVRKEEFVPITKVNGPQQVHSIGSFEHGSSIPSVTEYSRFQELEIPISLGQKMAQAIESKIGNAGYHRVDQVVPLAKEGKILEAIDLLLPSNQKGGNGEFTCVGLIEWAAEQAGHNGGQGFIPNIFETISLKLPNPVVGVTVLSIPVLSPELLAYWVNPIKQFSQQVSQIVEPIVDGVINKVVDGVNQVVQVADGVVEVVDGVVKVVKEVNQAVDTVSKYVNSFNKPYLQGFLDPVDFILTDPLGRRFGHTASLGTIEEIPGVFYTGNGSLEQFQILDPIPGNYNIELFGLGDNATVAIGGSSMDGLFVSEFLEEGDTRSFSLPVPEQDRTNNIADLSIGRTVSSEPITLGTDITYTLIATNNGFNNATGVTLEETLPEDVKFVSATSSKGTVSELNGVLTAELGNLNISETATVSITVTPIAAGSLISTSSIVGNEADPNITNNSIIQERTVNAVTPAPVDLELTKTADNPTPQLGEQITLTLGITNKGPGIASSIQVTDLLPQELTFISATPEQGTYDNTTGVWDVGNMRDNLTRTLDIVAQVNAPNSITTTAALVTVTETDINPINNQTSLTINPIGSGGSTSVPNQKLPIVGTSRNDYLVGTVEPDIIYGFAGNDNILGIGSSDFLYGNLGDDVIAGNQTNDLIMGGKGNDLLFGGQGKDQIYGGVGNDTLNGGLDQDLLAGGQDFDTFVLPTKAAATSIYLADTIVDFQVGVDKIALTDGLTASNLALTPVNNHTALQIAANNQTLAVVGSVQPNQLTNSFVAYNLA